MLILSKKYMQLLKTVYTFANIINYKTVNPIFNSSNSWTNSTWQRFYCFIPHFL